MARPRRHGAACAAAPGVRTEEAAQRSRRRRPTPSTPPTDGPARRSTWSSCPDLADGPDHGVGVRVGRRPARPRRPVGRHDLRRPHPAGARRRRRPPPARRSNPAVPARPASSSPGTSSTCCRPTCSTTTTRSAGTRAASVGRDPGRSTAAPSTTTGLPSADDVHRPDRRAARPGRRRRRRPRPRGGPRRARRRAPRLPRLQLRHGARRGVRDGAPGPRRALRARRGDRPDRRRSGRPARRRRRAGLRRRRARRRHRPLPRAVRRVRRVRGRPGQRRRSSTSSSATIRDLPDRRLPRRSGADEPHRPRRPHGRRSTYDPWSWGLVGDALRDGADGDASTLAALSSYLLDGYPVAPPGEERSSDFGARPLRHLLRRLQRTSRSVGVRGDARGRPAAGRSGRSTSPSRSS